LTSVGQRVTKLQVHQMKLLAQYSSNLNGCRELTRESLNGSLCVFVQMTQIEFNNFRFIGWSENINLNRSGIRYIILRDVDAAKVLILVTTVWHVSVNILSRLNHSSHFGVQLFLITPDPKDGFP